MSPSAVHFQHSHASYLYIIDIKILENYSFQLFSKTQCMLYLVLRYCENLRKYVK